MGALEMLRSATDFQRIQDQSRSRAHPALLVRYLGNDVGHTRFGISTGRKIGPAVVRNRVRRRLRTILRKVGSDVAPGWDILIVARQAAAAVPQRELEVALVKLLGSAGLINTDGEATATN